MKKNTLLLIAFILTTFFTSAQVIDESFDAVTLPAGWTQEYVSGTEDWAGVTANGDASIVPRTGSHMAEFRTTTGGNSTKLVTPSMDISGLTTPQLTFYYANVNWFGDIDELRVFYKTSAAGAWTQIGADYTAEQTAWTEVTLLLPSASADYYIAFEATSEWARGLNLDDVIVEEAPACPSPTTLVANTTSLTDVDLTWIAGNTETDWTYEYGVSPYVLGGGGTSGTVMTTPSLSLSGLTPGETYDLFLQANCGGAGDSMYIQVTWSQPNLGETCAAPIVVGALPYNTSDDTGNYGDNYDGTPGATNCGSTNNYLGGDDVVYSYTAALTGTVNIALSALSGTYSGIFVYDDCADIGVACASGAVNTGSTDYDFDLSVVNGETYYIIISTWPAPQSITYTLDITEILCPDPSGVMASNITPMSADLSWTDNGTTANWNIEIVDNLVAPTGTATATSTTTTYNATGLIAEMSYDFYVQADCGGSQGTWVGPFTFTTPCASISTFPSTTDFTNNPPTSCWSESGAGEVADGPTGTTSDWRANRSYQDAGGATVNSNALNLWQTVDREWLLSPTYTIPSGTPYGILIQVAVTDYAFSGTTTIGDSMDSDDEVKLLMTVDNGVTWTTLTTWNDTNEPGVNGVDYIADLSAVTGDVKFAVWGSDGIVSDGPDYDFHVGGFRLDTMAALSTESFDGDSSDFKFYPNPVKNNLTINAKSEISSVEVYNVLGQIVISSKLNTTNVQVDMSQLSNGAYFVKVISGSNTKTIRVIKN